VGRIETDLEVSIDLYPYTMEEFNNDSNLYNKIMTDGIFYNPLGIAKRM